MSDLPNPYDTPSMRRNSPISHVQRASKSSLGSDAERYHLLASIAESLIRIEDHLAKLVKAMTDD